MLPRHKVESLDLKLMLLQLPLSVSVLLTTAPVNILKANTKNVGGVAKGEMILGFREDNQKIEEMKQYLIEKGLEIEEVDNYVD